MRNWRVTVMAAALSRGWVVPTDAVLTAAPAPAADVPIQLSDVLIEGSGRTK